MVWVCEQSKASPGYLSPSLEQLIRVYGRRCPVTAGLTCERNVLGIRGAIGLPTGGRSQLARLRFSSPGHASGKPLGVGSLGNSPFNGFFRIYRLTFWSMPCSWPQRYSWVDTAVESDPQNYSSQCLYVFARRSLLWPVGSHSTRYSHPHRRRPQKIPSANRSRVPRGVCFQCELSHTCWSSIHPSISNFTYLLYKSHHDGNGRTHASPKSLGIAFQHGQCHGKFK